MPKQPQRKVCIVDDDRAVCDSLRALLEAWGYCVETFCRADDFLGQADIANADCFILDVKMPGGGGLSLLERLRDGGVTTPAILLAANGTKPSARMKAAGAFKLLQKPASEYELLAWIEKAVRNEI